MRKVFFTVSILMFFLFFAGAQEIPELNQKITEYVKAQLGKKVDRGECWDLAYEALTLNNCEWDGKFYFGNKLNPSVDSIYPGDIIQLYNVVLKHRIGNQIIKETYGQHTAVVYNKSGKGIFEIAHQNNGYSGRKVGISELNLRDKVSGTIIFFRPVAKTNR
ncbi:MAG TPA: hypothetical protein PKW80_06260 [Bacteroidales bacterium]|nr:hypothetical protein [Bacteroidales bacterium]